jgi:hypothetical protein
MEYSAYVSDPTRVQDFEKLVARQIIRPKKNWDWFFRACWPRGKKEKLNVKLSL